MNNNTHTESPTATEPISPAMLAHQQRLEAMERSDRADRRTGWLVLGGVVLLVGLLNRGCDLLLGPEYRPQSETGEEEADTGFFRGR
jgi:hypothetical protein